jgi:integrase
MAIRMYIPFLASKQLASSTIGNCIGHVNWIHAAHLFPTASGKDMTHAILLRGAKHIQRAIPSQETPAGPRAPIMAHQLRRFRKSLHIEELKHTYHYNHELYSIIIFMWQSLCRASEVTAKYADFGIPTFQRLAVGPNGTLLYKIPKSKTDQTGRGHIVPIAVHPRRDLCAISILAHLVGLRRNAGITTNYLWLSVDAKSPLGYTELSSRFKQLLECSSLDSTRFHLHSFRRGGATSKWLANVPFDCVVRIGRWSPKSTSVHTYISPSSEVLINNPREPCVNPFGAGPPDALVLIQVLMQNLNINFPNDQAALEVD